MDRQGDALHTRAPLDFDHQDDLITLVGARGLGRQLSHVDPIGAEAPWERFGVDPRGGARRNRVIQLQDVAAGSQIGDAPHDRTRGPDVERPLLGSLTETDDIVRGVRGRIAGDSDECRQPRCQR